MPQIAGFPRCVKKHQRDCILYKSIPGYRKNNLVDCWNIEEQYCSRQTIIDGITKGDTLKR